jgi:hypothetical protein
MYTAICAQCPDKAFVEPGTESNGKPKHLGIGYKFDGSQAADAARRDADHSAAPVPLNHEWSQRKILTSALEMIRAAAPTAVLVDLETSDQGRYGFVLRGIQDADGNELMPTEWVKGHPMNQLEDDVSGEIGDLDWDGVVGEDDGGYATIDLREYFAE